MFIILAYMSPLVSAIEFTTSDAVLDICWGFEIAAGVALAMLLSALAVVFSLLAAVPAVLGGAGGMLLVPVGFNERAHEFTGVMPANFNV